MDVDLNVVSTHSEPFLIQLFFAAQLRNEEIIALLEDQRAGYQARLAELERITIPPTDDPQQQRQMFAGMTLDLGIRMEHMYIDWLTDT
ncbi:MAG: hypothetical protein IAE80_10515, partial [Anaerolinea sp.]|nr:hypothetical protein [Anaerolinea sp.]